MEITDSLVIDEPDTESVGTPIEHVELNDDGTVTFQFPQLHRPKVAIVGFASGHHFQAPFTDEKVEIWGINRLHRELPDRRWDRWFELHDLEQFYRDDQEHRNFLKEFHGPVYVRAQDYKLAREWGIENAQPFPHEVLLQAYPSYFTNTVSWLIGLAVLMEPEWLGIYGVDMAQDGLLQAEYSQQRPSCEYFIGVANGRGIPTFIPSGADLLKATHLYGYEDTGPVLEKMASRFQELGRAKERIRAEMFNHQQNIERLTGQLSQLDGAMQEVTYWRKNWLTLPAGPITMEA